MCKFYLGDAGEKYHQIHVKNPLTNRDTKISIGRAALIKKKETFFVGQDEEEEIEASHLCHNKHCVLVDHISGEPHRINNSRKACVNEGFCMGHGRYPPCMVHLKM